MGRRLAQIRSGPLVRQFCPFGLCQRYAASMMNDKVHFPFSFAAEKQLADASCIEEQPAQFRSDNSFPDGSGKGGESARSCELHMRLNEGLNSYKASSKRFLLSVPSCVT